MIDGAITEGLEGLVMKDPHGVYEPGKRHWLKVKKDYLNEGQMADTADLLVLGAYFGTGNKGATILFSETIAFFLFNRRHYVRLPAGCTRRQHKQLPHCDQMRQRTR